MGYGAEVLHELFARHADSEILDGKSILLFVERYGNFERIFRNGLVFGELPVAQLSGRVRGV